MRSIAGILVMGYALFTLTSCSEAPSDIPDQSAGDDSATVQHAQPVDSPAVHDSHAGHAEHGDHAPGEAHASADHGESDSSETHPSHVHEPHASATAKGHNAHAQEHNAHAQVHNAHGQDQRRSKRHGRRRGHGHGESSDAASKIAIGEKVPDFEVTLNGKTWKLSELRQNREITPDGTLVLTFWCSFCHSCRHIELELDKLAKNYQGKAGVIALDASFGETQEGVSAFAKEKGLTLPIALSADSSAADVFGVNSTTTTVVIDSTGTLRYFGQFGDRQHAFAEDALKAVLAGKEVTVKSTSPKG